MQAGRLDRRITIQTLTETQDSEGHPVKSWSALDTVWAQALPVRGGEQFLNAQKYAESEMRFQIRYRTDVTVKHRIVYDGKNYDILAVLEIGRRRGLNILAKARAE